MSSTRQPLAINLLAIVSTASIFAACAVEVHDEPNHSGRIYVDDYYGHDHSRHDHHSVILPDRWKDRVKECDTYENDEGQSGLLCVEEDDKRWMSNCKSKECQAVPVNVHYMLTQDLGYNNRVMIEAFDNSKFTGSPVSSLEMTNFDASRAGTHSEDVVFLEPGEYYFRAFISNESRQNIPYEYQGMELVGDSPVGVFGALSDATRAIIDRRGDWTSTRSVQIYLDKLFKKPGAEVPTNAHLRIKLSVADDYETPVGNKVLIQLFDKGDFSYEPVVKFEMASENLRIVGSVGKAEFISPDLEVGRYFIRAFLDLSNNGYYDEGEPVAILTRAGEKSRANIIEDRTETIELKMLRVQADGSDESLAAAE